MEPDQDQPNVAIHPPTIFFSALLIGFIIRIFAGGWLPLPRLIGEGFGGLMMLGALVMAVTAISAFAEGGETLRPASPSQQLFTSGPFQFSRNPIYLAMMLFGAGFGVATLNLWIVLTTLGAGVIFNFFVIPQEEDYLARRFGAVYDHYRSNTRRWV
ncbi:MAG: protein-S-isoprenylcysteine methyltransferase [Hyphococcus sp.]|nr:MAG: protein-S-isoprenylcysteine methyltransferase [Marinicaulis sp.]